MRTQPATRKADGLRALLGGTVLAASLALIAGAWLGRGFTIDGGSMAPGLLGPHARLACPACQLGFDVGVEDGATIERPAACPNCGSLVERNSAGIADGDGVVVDRSAFQFRAPRRYEVASLREPNRAGQLCVKRVVGLPGERVMIRAGDVFINSEISRKNLAEQQAVALPVYDNAFQARDGSAGPARWQPAQNASRWRAAAGGFTATSENSGVDLGADDWLTYRHVVRVGDSAEFVESPILDTQAYNQTRPVVDPHEVRDLALVLEVNIEGPGTIRLRALHPANFGRRPSPLPPGEGESQDGEDLYCELDVSTGRCELRNGNHSLAITTTPPLADGRPHSLYFSTFDQQILLAIDGLLVFEHAFDETGDQAILPKHTNNADPARREPRRPGALSPARPFAIASDCAALRITGLRVLRDIYYTSVGVAVAAQPDKSQVAAETQLAADEFFVLSDNSRLGLDSRYASFGPNVPANLFVGKPLAAYSRSPRAAGWWGGIQVPAVWRIRYIR
jgi:type IV secretory pathway protease TraF